MEPILNASLFCSTSAATTDRYATMQPGSTDDDCGGHGTSCAWNT